MDTTIIERRSISNPPYWDGTTNFDEWKESITIFMQSVDFKLWLVTKNGSKIPTKSEDEFNDEDMKIMEQEAKAKNILRCALNPDALQRISGCKTAKEMWEKLNNVVTVSDTESNSEVYSTPPTSPIWSSDDTYPKLDFLEETGDGPVNRFLNLCVPLYKLALEGNWPEAKGMILKEQKLKNYAIATGWTTLLHIAAGANQIHFVKELLKMLVDNDINLRDCNGNTAFCIAAAAGNIEIVDLMFERNRQLPVIRGGNGYTPIQFAALQGRCKMTWHLYDKTDKDCFEDEDWNLLFFTCIYTGIYDLALKMVKERDKLAFIRDENEETALHLLAQNQMPLDSGCHGPEHDHNPGNKNEVVFQLVEFLWTTIVNKYCRKNELKEIINYPSQLIFDAAEVGNFRFLSELVSVYPGLIWDVDSKNRTIIHIAVLHRHTSIFSFVHKIGHIKGIIVTYEDEKKNNMLHLAAKLAPRDQLELVSGAAFQMCVELLWFEKVKKIMQPAFINNRNSDGLTAQELFSKEHAKLRENAESWMKKTAESCMLIATVIATGVFAAATSLPGGTNDDTGNPNYLKKTPFLVFAISDAFAFISSATAILIFLSILVSHYGEYDFYKSLPLKLIFGLITLFISITSMLVAVSSSFFIIYYHGSRWVPISIAILCFLPILLYIRLQLSLFSDIINSTYYWRTLSKAGKNMVMYK
ncbi:ankyrin repeat-containing protein ITN1 [Trifolium repens]|nr:ankyrin repeat-containing protein ITN1 [Trifolium repens]